MPNDLQAGKLADLRVAHLNIIQGIISRLAGFSAGVKNFCVTISAAMIAVAYQKQVPMLIGAAAAVVLIFCIMDTYYLALEKRYRELYEQVRQRNQRRHSSQTPTACEAEPSAITRPATTSIVTRVWGLTGKANFGFDLRNKQETKHFPTRPEMHTP